MLFNDAVNYQDYIMSLINAYLWSTGGMILNVDNVFITKNRMLEANNR